jgi:murein DD-endopeptidase MepM/ murein hydrolase activator NlpD
MPILSTHRAASSLRLLCLLASAGLAPLAGATEPELASPPRPDGDGGGEYVHRELYEHLTERQREEVWNNIHQNIRALEKQGQLPPASLANVQLAWPLRANGLSDPGYHAISNFVDHNPSYTGFIRDFSCGTRSYDSSNGYNHAGTDIYTWPFSWLKMNNNQVQVIAGAPGTIVYRSDGNYDRNCSFNNGNWNAVYVRHADGSIAWYGHLKNGSVTTKGVGATVAQGEYLGVVGSSGNSTGPHLHLEVYDSNGRLNDPFQGPCNATNPNSWWFAQRPYYDSAVNKLTTGGAPAGFPSCPTTETPNEKTAFRFGEPVYFTAYYRDQLSTQPGQYRIYRPDGSLFTSWTHSSPAAHYSSSWWYWYWTRFAPTGPSGTWRFEVAFNGQTHVKYFTMSP